MEGADRPRPGAAAEGARLIADALDSALLDLAEALAPPAKDDAAPSPAPSSAPPSAPERDHPGRLRSLVSLPARAAGDLATSVAAGAVPAIVERIDVNALLAKVDVNALLAKVDVNALVKRVDVGAIVDSIDPNPLLEKVDVDELVGRMDVGALAEEALEGIDIGDLIQDSTASIATDTLAAVRVQAMRADDLLARIVDRVLLRRRPRDTALARPAATP